MRTGIKVLIGVVLVGTVAAAAILNMTFSREDRTAVRVETVGNRDLVATVTASGNVRATRKVDISSDISARVSELLIEEGDDVEEGQILLRLDPTRYQAALDRSMANLSQAQSQVAQSRANFLRAERQARRMAQIWASDSLLVSRQDVENAETDLEIQSSMLDASTFGVSQSEAAVEEARDQLSKTVIIAPMTGRVTRLNVEQGETVIVGTMNNPGSLVLTVSDLSVMEVVLEVDETDVPEIMLGDYATVELDAFPEMEFPGYVTQIGNSAIRPPSQSAGSGQTPTIDFEVIVTLVPPEVELRPDLSATAEVVIDTRNNQLSVPIISVTLREEDEEVGARGSNGNGAREKADPIEGVFVIREGRVTFTPVEIGIAGDEYFEVISGLALGDSIVSGPWQVVRELEDGDAVEPDDDLESEDGQDGSN
ncbi:MAG: efflux RND transporter periplasmic adaptor subunit [Gemmatimonadetes bacterium]|nr:efflux RND transporter periplasmic adaptor subunit [Gemmatimonadota bacterium]